MSIFRRLSSAFLLLFILTGLLASAAFHPVLAQKKIMGPVTLDAFIQGQIKKAGFPGMAVAVIQEGKVTLLKGYGTASTGEPITPQSSMYIGSVSKSFTALVTLRLAEQGKINLDAPVKTYIPEFRLADEKASQLITVRHLLNQVSGLCGVGDEDPNQTAPTMREQTRRLSSMKLSSAPGEKFCYNNHNYSLLGDIAEAASGKPYAELVQQLVFTPLDMANSGTDPQKLPKLAKPYGHFFGFAYPREQPFFPSAVPAGYILSSAEDLTHYVMMLMDSGVYQGKTILTKESHQTLWAPRSDLGSPYAMGWHVVNNAGETLVQHNGAIESYGAEISMLPERKTAVLFIGNQNSALQAFAAYPDFGAELLNFVAQKNMNSEETAGRIADGITEDNKEIVITGMRILFVLDMLLIALRFALLGRTSAWVQKRPALVAILWIGIDILIPLGVLTLIFGSKMILGLYLEDLIQFLPDLTFWFLLGAVLGLTRGLAKIFLLLRSKTQHLQSA